VEINVKPWASTRPPFTVTYDIPSYVSLVNWFQDVLAYLESMGITSAEWKMEEDWAIYVGLPGLCIFMGWNAEEKIYVPAGMLNNPLTGADYQSFCHEYAHRLSYIANGHKSAIPLSIYYPDP
jgi:hypothetical protein